MAISDLKIKKMNGDSLIDKIAFNETLGNKLVVIAKQEWNELDLNSFHDDGHKSQLAYVARAELHVYFLNFLYLWKQAEKPDLASQRNILLEYTLIEKEEFNSDSQLEDLFEKYVSFFIASEKPSNQGEGAVVILSKHKDEISEVVLETVFSEYLSIFRKKYAKLINYSEKKVLCAQTNNAQSSFLFSEDEMYSILKEKRIFFPNDAELISRYDEELNNQTEHGKHVIGLLQSLRDDKKLLRARVASSFGAGADDLPF